jgi:hypothetical protein
MSSATIGI